MIGNDHSDSLEPEGSVGSVRQGAGTVTWGQVTQMHVALSVAIRRSLKGTDQTGIFTFFGPMDDRSLSHVFCHVVLSVIFMCHLICTRFILSSPSLYEATPN